MSRVSHHEVKEESYKAGGGVAFKMCRFCSPSEGVQTLLCPDSQIPQCSCVKKLCHEFVMVKSLREASLQLRKLSQGDKLLKGPGLKFQKLPFFYPSCQEVSKLLLEFLLGYAYSPQRPECQATQPWTESAKAVKTNLTVSKLIVSGILLQ